MGEYVRSIIFSIEHGDRPHFFYPAKVKQNEGEMSADFTVHSAAEMAYIQHHGYEPDFLAEFLQTVKQEPNCTIMDVGAGLGYFSVFAALQRGVERVYSFEFDPENRGSLIENVRQNEPQATMSEVVVVPDITTLDNFCRRMKVAPDIVKVNIKGGEIRTLKGMRGLLALGHPRHLFLALYPGLAKPAIEITLKNHYQVTSAHAGPNGMVQCHFALG